MEFISKLWIVSTQQNWVIFSYYTIIKHRFNNKPRVGFLIKWIVLTAGIFHVHRLEISVLGAQASTPTTVLYPAVYFSLQRHQLVWEDLLCLC